MHDLIPHTPPAARSLKDFALPFVLSPRHWSAYDGPRGLEWRGVKFSSANASHVPDDAGGIYTFVAKSEVAQHPHCAHLLYVGKTASTDTRDFRVRFREYLQRQASGDYSRRPWLTWMLDGWRDHLWFYFAPVADAREVERVEDSLLAAWLPPFNKDFPGHVSLELRQHGLL